MCNIPLFSKLNLHYNIIWQYNDLRISLIHANLPSKNPTFVKWTDGDLLSGVWNEAEGNYIGTGEDGDVGIWSGRLKADDTGDWGDLGRYGIGEENVGRAQGAIEVGLLDLGGRDVD